MSCFGHLPRQTDGLPIWTPARANDSARYAANDHPDAGPDDKSDQALEIAAGAAPSGAFDKGSKRATHQQTHRPSRHDPHEGARSRTTQPAANVDAPKRLVRHLCQQRQRGTLRPQIGHGERVTIKAGKNTRDTVQPRRDRPHADGVARGECADREGCLGQRLTRRTREKSGCQ